MLTHGVSCRSVFISVWGVINCVNNNPKLAFNFPTFEQQKEIASGYQKMSGANFDNVIGAIDGILIWILKPTLTECLKAKCGEISFMCSRKDKYGLNMQAICDHKLKFTWIDIRWPGVSSDYMAWITSTLCNNLEEDASLIVLIGMTIIGDAAYVKSKYMAVPFKSVAGDEAKDAYNFYQSQLRVSIERAFGVLVHRWAILRGPLNIPLFKVGSVVMCLCRLHNFCIDCSDAEKEEGRMHGIVESDASNLHRIVRHARRVDRRVNSNSIMSYDVVAINEQSGRPDDIMDGGEHFNDCGSLLPRTNHQPTDTPMDAMFESVKKQELRRPPVKE